MAPARLWDSFSPTMPSRVCLDYSQGMLDMVQQYKEKHQLNNITLLHKSWSDNWDDVPQADVILASRSTLVDDLDDMIEKLQSKAKTRF